MGEDQKDTTKIGNKKQIRTEPDSRSSTCYLPMAPATITSKLTNNCGYRIQQTK